MNTNRFQSISMSILTFIAIYAAGHSQTNPTWATAYTANYPYSYYQSDLAIDASANIYISGSFQDTSWSDIGSILLKYTASGSLEWSRTYDSLNYFSYIAIDNADNIYLTAQTVYGGDSIIVLKYDPTGNLIWTRKSATGFGPRDIMTDDLNNVYVSGYTFPNGFVTLKYDSSGNLLWTALDSLASGNGNLSLTLDNDYNVYLCGVTYDTCTHSTIFKYNSSGIKQWKRNYQGDFNPACVGGHFIKMDALNNLFSYSYAEECGSGTTNTALCKYDTAGNLIWDALLIDIKSIYNSPSSIAVDDLGNLYTIGQLNGQNSANDSAVIVKINSSDGIDWMRYYSGGSNWDIPMSIIYDNGFVYVTGRISGESAIPFFYTIKYDINGNVIWSGSFANTMFSSNFPTSIGVDNFGDVVVSGKSYGFNSTSIVTLKYSHSIGLEELNEQNYTLTYPNPFDLSFSLQTFKSIENGTFNLFDITGKSVMTIDGLSGNEWTIQRNDLSSGMYFYTLTEKSKIIGKGKLIAE